MKKFEKLKEDLKNYDKVILAYSGGIDSSVLAKVCHDVFGNNFIAITIKSQLISSEELRQSIDIAKEIGFSHHIIDMDIFSIPQLAENSAKRCYYCKKTIINELLNFAETRNYKTIIEASNCDDTKDYRPGMQAVQEHNIIQPYLSCCISKDDIRNYAKIHGLSFWNKPSMACLASRIPYYNPITHNNLKMVEEAEEFLRGYNFYNLRIRYHSEIARIEVDQKDFSLIIKYSKEIHDKLKSIGFTYITLDLQGFRSGSLNENL